MFKVINILCVWFGRWIDVSTGKYDGGAQYYTLSVVVGWSSRFILSGGDTLPVYLWVAKY